MANIEHVEILEKGVAEWNRWREEHPDARPDLSGALLHAARLHDIYFHWANLGGVDLREGDLWGAQLEEADLRRANLRQARLLHAYLRRADLEDARLVGADLEGANLGGANLRRVDLTGANLRGANLEGAILCEANLTDADLEWADCSEADLRRAVLVGARVQESDFYGANLSFCDLSHAYFSEVDLSCTGLVEASLCNATLTDCRVYGTSVWHTALMGASQHRLTITQLEEPDILVDDLSVAPLVYAGARDEFLAGLVAPRVVLVLGNTAIAQAPPIGIVGPCARRRAYWPVWVRPNGRDWREMAGLTRLGRHALVDLAAEEPIAPLAEALVSAGVCVQPVLAEDGTASAWARAALGRGLFANELYRYREARDIEAVIARWMDKHAGTTPGELAGDD